MGRLEHFWHGTRDPGNAESIMAEGFHLKGAGSTGGSDYGTGVYATTDKGWAAEHAFGIQGGEGGTVMGVSIHPDKPLHGYDVPPHIHETAVGMAEKDRLESRESMRRRGKAPEEIDAEHAQGYHHFNQPRNYYPEAIQHHGHDAWIHGSMAVVYDPSKIKPTGENYTEEQMYPDRYDEEDDWSEPWAERRREIAGERY